ncbi:MAG TPA: YerC/YecD family TrpR-related protein [Patescibacteria group bacterium]|nr:YerC/YecD family TrpR-related protein [Patescibacteria group bacterium]
MSGLKSNDTKELLKAVLLLKTEDEAKRFLRDLLTEAEIKEFANRWKVVRLLDKKIPYEQITKQTGMSSTTIARIAKWLHGTFGGYKLMLKRINKSKKVSHHASLSAA